jgi:predicted amidophosphoribosyltransferase
LELLRAKVLAMVVTFSDVWFQTWNTLSPVRCAGCGVVDEVCCVLCRKALLATVHEPELAIRKTLFDIPVYSALRYAGVVRRIMTAYKDHGVAALTDYVATPFAAVMAHIPAGLQHADTAVVCVPHSRSGWVKRGRQPMRDIVARAGYAGPCLPPSVLRRTGDVVFGGVRGQVQKEKTRRDRLRQPPAFVASAELAGARIVLVDDVVTTGITIEWAARAVEKAGGVVVACAVLAATPPPQAVSAG